MKNLFNIIWISCLCLFTGSLFGQGENPHYLKMMGQSDGSRVMLRWVVSDYETWQEGVAQGFILERYKTHENGVRLDGLTTYNSKIVLGSNLRPLSEAQWNAQFPNNNFGQLAKGTLYEEDVTIEVNGDPTLADALNASESKDSRFLFALFAAEQDFAVAQGMALGFEDQGIEAGVSYVYSLRINSTNTDFNELTATVVLNTDDRVELPAIAGLIGSGADHAAFLEWNIQETATSYSSYDVERSTDRVNFTKVNDLPFIFGADGTEDPEIAAFRDSLEDNTTTYYYQVRGRTAFGLQGPPSEMVEVQGVPARVRLFLKIDDFDAQDSKVELHWDSFDGSMQNEVEGFNIYRSLDANVDFEQVNTNLLPPSSRAFTDDNPLSTAYYHLEAIDKNGHSYTSPSALVQLPDSTPPAIPTGLAGEFITPTRVELTWDANREEDLQGYRILVANKLESNYTQITSHPVVEERFVYEIDPEFIAENIYFKIMATDHRDNYSDKSDPVEIERPDKIAPSMPVMHKVSPAPEGVQIGFRFSSSPDVVRHVLERKPAGSPGWVEVLTILSAEEDNYRQNLSQEAIASTCYVDTTILERREYDYRFLAYDDHENVSSSDVITIRPYDNGLRGTINAVNGIVECVPLGDVANPEAYEIIDYLILYYGETGNIDFDAFKKLVYLNMVTESELNDQLLLEPFEINVFLNSLKMEMLAGDVIGKIFLKWDYDAPDQLVDFQIFRSTEGSDMMLYKTLPLDQLPNYIYEDEDVKPGRRYFYQVMARHQGGGFSERSEMVMVKVPRY